MVFKHPPGVENLPGHHVNSTTPIPLAPSLAPGYPTVFPNPTSGEPYFPPYRPDPRSYYGQYYGPSGAPPGYFPHVDRNIRLTTTAPSQLSYPSQVPALPADVWDGQNNVGTHRHSTESNIYPAYGDQSRRNIPGSWHNAYGAEPTGIQGIEQSEEGGLSYGSMHHNYLPDSAPPYAHPQYAVPSAHLSRHHSSVPDDWQSITPPSASATNGVPLSLESNTSQIPPAQGPTPLSRQGMSLSGMCLNKRWL